MYADFGYMEEGKLGKPYDLKLMVRLGAYLKRYWFLMSVSFFFVLVMAVLDLVIPYLTKEAIDRYIITSAREVVLRGDGSPEERRLLKEFEK
ncbi:MAG: ABC transporter ATP-binding protein, partial [Deltaproteobacteria bacterium]|nr:ABC transporter ATP-binding protein [Deltaproteobacteria bacterium]